MRCRSRAAVLVFDENGLVVDVSDVLAVVLLGVEPPRLPDTQLDLNLSRNGGEQADVAARAFVIMMR